MFGLWGLFLPGDFAEIPFSLVLILLDLLLLPFFDIYFPWCSVSKTREQSAMAAPRVIVVTCGIQFLV